MSLSSAPRDKVITLRLPGVADNGVKGQWSPAIHAWVTGDPPQPVYPSEWTDA
jgi:hypothetical protein